MLQTSFAKYLEPGARPEGARELALALGAQLPSDAEALHHFGVAGPGWFDCTSEPLATKRVYVGPTPPDAPAGAFWFDSCELSPMLLVPAYVYPEDRDQLAPEAEARLAKESSWLALRPVARFQYAAFLDVRGRFTR